MLILSRDKVREVDRRAVAEYGMSGLVLMENAGRGATDVLCSQWAGGGRFADPRMVVVCGKGNNGGDGFVIARHLDLRGWPVMVLLLAEPKELRGDAAANFGILEKAGLEIQTFGAPLDEARFRAALAGAGYLVDAILGTGATGEPKSPYAEAINLMNASGVPILAVDLPSGLDCDTGAAARHTIRAANTATFVAAKPGFFVAGADQYVGEIHVCDIGVPRRLVEEVARSAR
ncbi:MAG TPA: NAD(P)H-hydrate epimerase [Pirellulales bacterium]|nr:NAD(P)H-hydrate epimerase [Pirellulales bacterium]